MQVARDVPFADQGITSNQNTMLAKALASYFPGIGPHGLYRFTSLDALITGWDAASPARSAGPLVSSASDTALEVRSAPLHAVRRCADPTGNPYGS